MITFIWMTNKLKIPQILWGQGLHFPRKRLCIYWSAYILSFSASLFLSPLLPFHYTTPPHCPFNLATPDTTHGQSPPKCPHCTHKLLLPFHYFFFFLVFICSFFNLWEIFSPLLGLLLNYQHIFVHSRAPQSFRSSFHTPVPVHLPRCFYPKSLFGGHSLFIL